jgi:hypothetical protein
MVAGSLRGDPAPDVLKSAAHAMKHSEARQASGDYDQEADDRLVRAAYDFNLAFAANYVADASGAAAGSSSAAAVDPPPAPPPQPLQPLPEEVPLLADEEWRPLEGGPWKATLMRPSRQPVPTATYRNFQMPLTFDPNETPLVPSGKIKLPIVAGGPSDGIVLQLPASWSARSRQFMFRLKLSKEGATESEVTINQIVYRAPVVARDSEEEDEPEEAADAANGDGGGDELLADEPPVAEADAVVPLAAIPPDALPGAVAPGDGPPLPRTESVVGSEEGRAEAMAGEEAAVAAEEAEEAAQEAAEAAAMEAVDEPPPPPPMAPPPPPPVRGSERKRKAASRFGDGGELDGPASRFRSASAPRKPSIEPSLEMGVPAYALPGEEVVAWGLHAGVRKRFRARVTGLRKLFPRIVVKYVATEDGTGTHPLQLPDPVTAYLTASDVEPGSLVMVRRI